MLSINDYEGGGGDDGGGGGGGVGAADADRAGDDVCYIKKSIANLNLNN